MPQEMCQIFSRKSIVVSVRDDLRESTTPVVCFVLLARLDCFVPRNDARGVLLAQIDEMAGRRARHDRLLIAMELSR